MNKEMLKKDIVISLIMIIFSLVYVCGVIWFLEPAKIYAGGVSGLSQLLRDVIYNLSNGKVSLSLGLLTIVFNIPVFIIGWKGVSKRFVIYSAISVFSQAIFLDIIPFVDFSEGRVLYGNDGLIMLYALMGGILTAVPCALILKCGGSTGGIDILGQYLAFKKNISIGMVTLIINGLLAICCGWIYGSALLCFYTIIRIIINSIVIDKIHNAYVHVSVEIITVMGEEVSRELTTQLERGVTAYKAVGMYTHQEKMVLKTIISRFQLPKLVKIVKEVDKKSFITVTKVSGVIGYFKRKTIM